MTFKEDLEKYISKEKEQETNLKKLFQLEEEEK